MTLNEIVNYLNGIAWGPWMLILLVGTGVFLSARVGFIQFAKFGYVMKNTLGKLFKKQTAGEGEVTPFQALATAIAAQVGTGNIVGASGAGKSTLVNLISRLYDPAEGTIKIDDVDIKELGIPELRKSIANILPRKHLAHIGYT